MADKNIGALPQAAQLNDDSLLVVEQQGQAMKINGAQFKEFGRQAVIGQVQGYVDEAEKAAEDAKKAASAVVDMTVEASTLPPGSSASVAKSMKNDKVNLAFGIPKGDRGEQGEQGEHGLTGPRGEPGTGLKILGYYDTLDEMKAAHPDAQPGDAYGIGTEPPYDVYVFDGATNDWKNTGPLSEMALPDNLVTTEGGAQMLLPGTTPHVIEFINEEEPPLTAEDVVYSDTETVKQAIYGLKSSVSDGKSLVASAITDKGVPTAQDATFTQMAENIGQIETGGGGTDTSDATATSFDILSPKTAYTATGKVTGVISTLPAQTITPGTSDQTISNGQYLGGTQTIKGDPNLTSNNIRKGKSIFGVAGAMESSFLATLTVTADTGAVVTAKNGDTEVSGLSTNGQVVLELPIEGTWKVTAVRGVTQYNTVTIQVSSHYTATLTAALHVEYYGLASSFNGSRSYYASASTSHHALFAGGDGATGSWGGAAQWSSVEAYDQNLTNTTPTQLPTGLAELAGASNGEISMFGGGRNNTYQQTNTPKDYVRYYDGSLTASTITSLSVARYALAAAAVGDYILFAGGMVSPSEKSAVVDSYNLQLSKGTASPLVLPSAPVAGSNSNYAMFYGEGKLTAYNSSLTRTSVDGDAESFTAAARAGNYVVFCGKKFTNATGPSNIAVAYDLFLTRTTLESLNTARANLAGTTLKDFAIFGFGNTAISYSPSAYSTDVDVYDPFLVHTVSGSGSLGRFKLCAASVGNYALFGSGMSGTGSDYAYTNKVDVYQYV